MPLRRNTMKTKTAKSSRRSREKMGMMVVTRERLPKCWMYNEKEYILVAKGGKPIERKLPYVDAKYTAALREAGIGCNVIAIPNKYEPSKQYEVCEYYDPEMYKKERLPVYIQMQNNSEMYIFTGDIEEHNAVTVETIKRASALQNKVKYICAKQDLAGKMGITKYCSMDRKELDLEGEDGGRIKMIQAYSVKIAEDGTEVCKPTKLYGVFDMVQVENKHYIQVVAEDGAVRGTAIGKDGKNKAYWEELLGGGRKIVFV